MKLRNTLSTRRAVNIAFGMIIAFGIPTFGQEAPLQNEASAPQPTPAMNEILRHNIENWALQGRGVPEDWSNHHLIFSDPGTEEDAIASGTHDRWLKIVNDPRYILQQMKRSSGMKTLPDPETASLMPLPKTEPLKKPKPTKGKIKKDWTETLKGGGQAQPNMYPGKFSFSTTVASCSGDFVVYPTGVPGAMNSAANIIAYNELYGTNSPNTGCGTASVTVPSVYWAYNTGGTVTTSPIISEGGSQVAFIQVTGTTASLVLLKWAAGNGTLSTPDNLTVQSSASNYRNCTAPCFYAVSLGANDTYSAPFYDYLPDDAIYVGDDSGKLHKITGVFYGTTIAEASGWPVTLNATYQTASPVYDPTSGNVFVGNVATGTNAALYAVNSTSTTIHTSSGLGDAIVDGTLVDPTTEEVYAFVTTDGTGHNGVYQFAAGFASGTAGTEKEVGFGGTDYYFYSGNFDNVYYSAASGAAGDLWVVGNTGGSSGGGGGGVNLYRIPIGIGNAMGTPVAAISNLTAANTSTPETVTEYTTNNVNVTSASATGSISLNLSGLTSSANNRLLVGISIVGLTDTTPTVSTVKWGGSSGTDLTSVCTIPESASSSNWVSMAIYELQNPSAISSTVAITLSGSTVFQAGAVVFTNVGSLGTCVTTTTRGVSDVSSTSVTVTAPGTGGAVFDTLAAESIEPSGSFFMTPGGTQNSLWNLVEPSPPGGANCAPTCTAGGAGSYAGNVTTMSYSFPGPSESNTAYGAVPLIAAENTIANYGWPSPLAEFCNGGLSGCTASGTATTSGTDYIFFSVDRLATATTNCGTGAGQGCILAYSIDTPTNAPTPVGSAQFSTTGPPGCWSTSGIVVDNSVPSGTLAGASQIYTLEFNGNGAGGPTDGTYTSSACNNNDSHATIAFQGAQSSP